MGRSSGRPRQATQVIRTQARRVAPATCPGPPSGTPPGFLSYFHDFALFAAGQGVDFLDLGLGDLLQAPRGALRLVLRHLALLLHLLDAVELIAADVADGDPRLLGLLADELDVLLAALLGQLRDRHADHLAVVGGVQALVARAERLLDRADLALVVDLDDQQARLGGADLGELVERRGRAVVRDHDPVDQRGIRAPGADVGQLGTEVVDRLAHLRLGFAQDWINHGMIPTPSP